ncbi:MAG: hypothetical protein KC425_27465, partial [Anaerolineales bacterium]|nr:hypothetical protein [Anaerolineales bacterium]
MINQELLQELVSFHVPQNRVVSLYLNTDSAQQPVETIKLQAKSLLKEANSHNEANVAAIDRYLNHDFDWTRPGLALFAATDEDFFRAYPVAVSFRNRIRIGQKPYIKPLAHFLDYYA